MWQPDRGIIAALLRITEAGDGFRVKRDSGLSLAWRRVADWVGPLVALLVMGAALSFAARDFLTGDNLANVARQAAVIAILAVAETIVIIGGGIDLSVGSVTALTGVTAAVVMSRGTPAAIAAACLAGILCGLACGAISGLLTAYGRMPSFIATLGMMGIARGVAFVVTAGQNVTLPAAFPEFAAAEALGIPVPALVAAVVAVAAHILLSRTVPGRHTYAIGGNAEAARLSGIPVKRVVTILFALSGLLSGIAGLVLTSRLTIGQPTAGQGYELDAIAAAVIGGASLMGGQGTIPGTAVGAAIIGVLRNGLNLLNVEVFWQQVAIGVIIIAAVFFDQFRRRR